PAFMRGRSYLRLLERASGRLSRFNVQFIGHADAAMKAALFRTADLYVFPSRHESYGLTLCEAIAAGVPAITTDHYSARELLGPGGIVTPRDNPRALASAIYQALHIRMPSQSPAPRPFS